MNPFGSIFLLSPHYVYALVRFGHKTYWLGLSLKYCYCCLRHGFTLKFTLKISSDVMLTDVVTL